MKYVVLPDERIRPLSFYLATEDYLAQNMDGDDLLMLWQVEPSVIYGRNQVVENEVNLDYCRENGIRVYQRKSGGGCVYADKDNLMWSFVTSEDNVGFAFNRFVTMVLLVLRKMGIEATGTSHNDIMIGEYGTHAERHHPRPGEVGEEGHPERAPAHHLMKRIYIAESRRGEDIDQGDALPRGETADGRGNRKVYSLKFIVYNSYGN